MRYAFKKYMGILKTHIFVTPPVELSQSPGCGT